MKKYLVVVAIVLSGCHSAPKHHLERVSVTGETISDNAILGMTEQQVQSLFEDKLRKNGHFVLPDNEEKQPIHTARFELELSFTRTAEKQGRKGTWAEVGATGALRVRSKDETRRYEVVGLGEVPVEGDSPEARKAAAQKALTSAVEQIVSSGDILLTALTKTNKELEQDLKSSDPRVKEFAIRTLAERGDPVVTDVLLEKLRTNDPEEVRRAMGALVEMHEKRAVPVLIEISKNRDASFVREVVFALGSIGGEDAEAYLFTVAQGADQPEVESAAKQALAELRHREGKGPVPPDEEQLDEKQLDEKQQGATQEP